MTKYTLPAGITHSGVTKHEAVASSYTVNLDSYIVDEDPDSQGLYLDGGGLWTVAINGGVSAADGDGLFVDAPSAGTANAKVTVGTEGSLHGSFTGMWTRAATDVTNSGIIDGDQGGVLYNAHLGGTNLTAARKVLVDNRAGATISGAYFGIDNRSDAALTVKNAGTITADNTDGFAIGSESSVALTNSGQINGYVHATNGKNMITNSGRIEGSLQYSADEDRNLQVSIDIDQGSSTIGNTGTIIGTVVGSGDGADVITNSGVIYGDETYGYNSDDDQYFQVSVNLRGGNDSLTNSKEIYGDVWVGEGNDTITNSGSIYGYVDAWDGDDKISNTGSIYSTVDLGEGVNTLTNSKLITNWVVGGDGGNTITNKGTIQGAIELGAGNDKVTNTGAIWGSVNLGAGNDSFTGGNNIEGVFDDEGNDTYNLGGGNDYYAAAADSGLDTVAGGTGVDAYDAISVTTGGLSINLATTANAPYGLAATTAKFGGSTGSEKVTGLEIVNGSNNADVIFGGAIAETLYGNDGADIIGGGGGADKLWGGDGADKFVLLAAKDSGVTRATSDTIMDFSQGSDQIDLSNIDANTTVAGFDEFHTLIANDVFTGSAGQLRYVWQGGQTIIQGDTNGDKKADFQIAMEGTITLQNSDIIGLTA